MSYLNVFSIFSNFFFLTLLDAKQSMKWTGDCYEINLPWKRKASKLPNNADTALRRFTNTEKRLLKQPELAAELSKIIDGYLAKGYNRYPKTGAI